MPNGKRPLIYPTAELLKEVIDGYFSYCDSQNGKDYNGKIIINKPYTISGLCDYINIHQDTLTEYGKRENFEHVVRMAKQKVESFVLEMASINKTNPIIAIFNLKNNFGYTDKIDVSTNTKTEYVNVLDIEKLVDDEEKLLGE